MQYIHAVADGKSYQIPTQLVTVGDWHCRLRVFPHWHTGQSFRVHSSLHAISGIALSSQPHESPASASIRRQMDSHTANDFVDAAKDELSLVFTPRFASRTS